MPGYITRFKPNLVYSGTRKVPRVDVIHLHHGVWLAKGYPTFAAGEEKTILQLPRGYGYHYDPSDRWIMNYMIHNLTPKPTQVSITYDIDFVPDSSAAAKTITPARPLWMDVSGLRAYPVFDAIKGQGRRRQVHVPRPGHGRAAGRHRLRPRVDGRQDMTLLDTAGHLHPGGLYTDLKVTRGGRTKELFRSEAKYFEPAGAVSWDVSMTATKPGWQIAVKARRQAQRLGDLRHEQGLLVRVDGDHGRLLRRRHHGRRRRTRSSRRIDTRGLLTHGHLPENNHHGGKARPSLRDARDARQRRLPRATSSSRTSSTASATSTCPASAAARRSSRPASRSPSRTSTRPPRSRLSSPRTTRSPRARRPVPRPPGSPTRSPTRKVQFDSGELGFGPAGFTPAANRNTWKTPKSLKPGTYTYFCRIHPFMRGSFRVVSDKGK